jgi:hypothetical protein
MILLPRSHGMKEKDCVLAPPVAPDDPLAGTYPLLYSYRNEACQGCDWTGFRAVAREGDVVCESSSQPCDGPHPAVLKAMHA